MLSATTVTAAAAQAKKILPEGSVNATLGKFSKSLAEAQQDFLANMYPTFRSFIPAGLWKSTKVPGGQFYSSTVASKVAARPEKDNTGQVLSNKYQPADKVAENGVR